MVRFSMTTIIILLASASAQSGSIDLNSVSNSNGAKEVMKDDNLKELFKEWIVKYNKQYNSEEERKQRFAVWKDTYAYIIKRNKEISFKLGLNAYSDLTLDEFHQRFHLGEYYLDDKEKYFGKKNLEESVERRLEDLPDTVNWVDAGAVIGVKDQGSCGSCWAFSAIASVETAKYLYDGELVSLSEQMVMDCDEHLIDNSCNGGNMGAAFDYVKRNEGICSEEDYPYLGDFQDCMDRSCSNVANTNISGSVAVKSRSTEALMSSIAIGTTSVSVDAGSDDFKSYESGVFTGECGTNLNHGIAAVGYDSEYGQDYWLVKNSWGTDWGDEGYMKLYREGGEGVEGTCGILLDSDRPLAPE